MINVSKCPSGTTIRQVKGLVAVEQWGSVLLQVDGEGGKKTIRLDETLTIPGISVNLFSLQRVVDMGYLPVYEEVPDKCVVKKVATDGTLTQVATMTIKKGRATLDSDPTDYSMFQGVLSHEYSFTPVPIH